MVAVPLCAGMIWFLFHQFTDEKLPITRTLEPLSPSESEIPTAPQPVPTPSFSPTPQILSTPQPAASAIKSAKVQPEGAGSRHGVLRISNPTDYPVRIALLAKKTSNDPTRASGTSDYDLPAHWDFAPQEGGGKGLLVSLPDRTVKLKPGDILVAFAQDGSRRYWGPYVVGATSVPVWNPKAVEWELLLPP